MDGYIFLLEGVVKTTWYFLTPNCWVMMELEGFFKLLDEFCSTEELYSQLIILTQIVTQICCKLL